LFIKKKALRNAQDSFSNCLQEFGLGLVGGSNEEEMDIGKLKLNKKQLDTRSF
jgi:hypothetical protein